MEVQGLRADIFDENGNKVVESNLQDPKILAKTKEALTKAPWYKSLLEEVKANKKRVLIVTTLGGISLFVAGFEFGVRGGKDIKDFLVLFKKHRTKKSKS